MAEQADVACEIRSICRDALTADRERDYLALGMFLLPSIWKYLAREVAVIEIRAKIGATFHTYPTCPVGGRKSDFPHRVSRAHDVGKADGSDVKYSLERLASEFGQE